MNDDYLIHYGILGMKWGVRKKRDPRETARRVAKGIKAGIAIYSLYKISKISKIKTKNVEETIKYIRIR